MEPNAYHCQHCGRGVDTCFPRFTQQGHRNKREVQVFCTVECSELYVVAEAGNGPLCRVCKAPSCSKRCAKCRSTYYCSAAHRPLCQQIVDTKYGEIPTEAGERGGVIFTDACFNN